MQKTIFAVLKDVSPRFGAPFEKRRAKRLRAAKSKTNFQVPVSIVSRNKTNGKEVDRASAGGSRIHSFGK